MKHPEISGCFFLFLLEINDLYVFIFSKLFKKSSNSIITETDPMKKFLIVGLGNIGPKYYNTRHNVGFNILDFLAEKESLIFESAKLGDITTYKLKGRTFLLLKPSTFMNLSGKAVRFWLEKEKIPLENVLVITDDLNLPIGTFRIKSKGSDGGHNGSKGYPTGLEYQLITTDFSFGIGDDVFTRKTSRLCA